MSRGESVSSKYPGDLDLRVGTAIKGLRIFASMTQGELAERAEVSQAYISLTESGRRNARLNLTAIQRIARVLGKESLSDLIRLAEAAPDVETAIAEAKRYFSARKRRKGRRLAARR